MALVVMKIIDLEAGGYFVKVALKMRRKHCCA